MGGETWGKKGLVLVIFFTKNLNLKKQKFVVVVFLVGDSGRKERVGGGEAEGGTECEYFYKESKKIFLGGGTVGRGVGEGGLDKVNFFAKNPNVK